MVQPGEDARPAFPNAAGGGNANCIADYTDPHNPSGSVAPNHQYVCRQQPRSREFTRSSMVT